MTRPLETLTALAFDKPVLPLAAIISLDIENDPLYCWSGIGDLTFAAGETGDPSLDGFTFKGTGTLIQISNVSEGVGGSDVLEVGLPGVDINEPMLRQLITFRRRWQFRRAVVWLMALDDETGAIAGKPFRIKTGRIDRMPLSESKGEGVVKCRIEGQQAYGNIPLGTRYSEQRDLNPNDTSQKFVHSLANMKATIGVASSIPGSGTSSGGMGGGGGNRLPFFSQKNEHKLMARLDNWQNNLGDLIEAKRNEAFSFPTHNCLMFVLDAVEAVTGNDHSKDYRGKYQTEKQAAAMLRKVDKVKTTQQLLELKLNQTLQPISFARMGDIVLTDGLDVGIELPTDIKLFGLVPGVCYGQFSYFVGEQGLVQTETLRLGGTLWVS